MHSQIINYQDGDLQLKGFFAYDDQKQGQRPTVLVAHDWTGHNAFAEQKAVQLAELGFAAFAIDMFGNGQCGETKEEKTQLIQPLMANRQLLQQRILAAFKFVQQLDQVNKQKIAAIGFCFGGLCVLDLARSGADLKGVVSFHGLYNLPENIKQQPIKAKILTFHGYDDPMATPEQFNEFTQEMTVAKADWQSIIYGNTMHAFTNPQANDPVFGTVYNATADRRSWQAMQNFLHEIFA